MRPPTSTMTKSKHQDGQGVAMEVRTVYATMTLQGTLAKAAIVEREFHVESKSQLPASCLHASNAHQMLTFGVCPQVLV